MKYKHKPNAAQKAAIEAPIDGALRLISGPGSGKTFVQEHRYAFLVESGVKPDSILAVVFNRRNAEEFKERVAALVPQAASTQWITTIHAACYRIFKDSPETFPNCERYQVLQSPTKWLKYEKFSIKSFIQDMAEDLWPNPDGRPGWKEVWLWINSSKMEGLTPAESGQFFLESLGDYHGDRVYQINVSLWRKMKQLKVLTFADMLLLVDVSLRRDAAFRERWQAQFTHVLLDEAQDASAQAMRIATALAEPQNNFFATGDIDQLLYRWIGATPEANLLDGFEERYPHGATVFMGVNYRSRNSTVIDMAARLIKHNYADAGGPYDQKYLKELEPMPGAEPGEPFTFTAYDDPESEADGVADTVAALLAGEDEDGFATGGCQPGDIFVGARTRAQLGYLEGPLLRREIPFINITGGSFWESRHVADVIAYVRLAHDPGDAEAFERVFNVGSNWMTTPWKKSPHYGEYCPHRYLGAAFLRATSGTFRGISQALRGRDGWRYRAGADDLESFVYEIQEHLDDPAGVVRYVIDNCYEKWLRHDEGLVDTDQAENGKLEDLKTVLDIAANHGTVGEFLAYVAEAVEAAKAAREGNWDDYVILSTVHRLKGLQRKIIFGIGWAEGYAETKEGPEPRGLLPHTFSLIPPPQNGVLPTGGMGRVEDERCLAFVLITRAEEQVHLSYPRTYRMAEMGPSRFAVEMGLADEPAPKPEQGDPIEELFDDPDHLKNEQELAANVRLDPERGAKDLDLAAALGEADFPDGGQFEGNIYRFSAGEIMEALPEYRPTVDGGQLVLARDLGGGSTVLVYTSVRIGQIAGGTGDDSIRVVRRDETPRGTFFYKEAQDWITRQVPKAIDTPEKAVSHIVGKITDMVDGMIRTCPKCGGTAVKCRRKDGGEWWKCLGGYR